MGARLRAIIRPLRRGAHSIIAALRGGRGVLLSPAPGWKIAVSPAGYEDLRYWLRYEAPTFALLRRIWRPGMNVLDVGAHHGVFALCCCPAHALPARIITVEPSTEALPLLRANRATHPGLDWQIVAAAVGDHTGHVTLQRGFIHMLVVDAGLHGLTGAGIEVPMTTLDAICREQTLKPDLVKLDVEGYEAEALRGAGEMLHTRPAVVLEWHCAMLRQRGLDPLAALEPLRNAGYSFEPYEHPELGVIPAAALASLPPRDLYRMLCRYA